LSATASRLASAGIDTQLLVRVDDSLEEGVVHTAHAEHATLLVLPADACGPPAGLPTIVVGPTGADGVETHGLSELIDARLASLGCAPMSSSDRGGHAS